MPTRQIRALALSLLLAVSLTVPAAAAPNRDDGDPGAVPITKVVKQIVKVVVHVLDTLTLPKP